LTLTLTLPLTLPLTLTQVSETQMVDLFVENDGLDQQRGVVYLYHLRKKSALLK
jgi:hypothetical protein